MKSLRGCVTSMVQFLTVLSITFLLFVIVYFAFPDGTTPTYIHVTVSDRASVLAHDTAAMISFRKTDDNDTSKGKVAT